MTTIHHQVQANCPPERVWALLSDLEAVQRYNLFSGGGAVPPLWGLGLKFRTYTRADESNVVATAAARPRE